MSFRPRRTSITQVAIALAALGSAVALGLLYERIDHRPFGLVEKEAQAETARLTADNYSFNQVNEICEKNHKQIKTIEDKLVFEEPKTTEERKTICPWETGDNIDPRPNKLATRYEKVVFAQLPPKSVLCGVEIEAVQKPFRRQDFFILTWNNRILATDAPFLFKYFQEETVAISETQKIASYLYDWSRILGARTPKEYSEARREYCVGSDISLASCGFGNGEPPRLQIHSKIARWLGTKSIGPNQKFSLVVTGDSDIENDCRHSGLELKLKLSYAPQ